MNGSLNGSVGVDSSPGSELASGQVGQAANNPSICESAWSLVLPADMRSLALSCQEPNVLIGSLTNT